MPRTATAANEVDQRTIQILADVAGIQDLAVSLGNETSIATENGTRVTGVTTVCSVLAATTPQGKALLGDDTIQQAEVHEWASFRHAHLTPVTDDGLRALNERLASRTYVAVDQLSLADVVLYAATDAAVPTVFVPPAPPTPKQAAPAPAASKASDTPATAGGTSKDNNKKPAPSTTKDSTTKENTKENTTPPPDTKDNKKAAKKQQKPANPDAKTTNAKTTDIAVDMLDIRVGTIMEVGKHPNADALYLEKIDVGEDAPRQVVSGLVRFVPEEAMQGRRVLVVCNLKPAKMRDVMSYGMVLCASNEAHDAVDPVRIPEGVPNGERVTFAGFDREPEAQINPKKKIFEQIAPDLKTNSDGVVVYKGTPCMTTKGPVTATIPNGSVA